MDSEGLALGTVARGGSFPAMPTISRSTSQKRLTIAALAARSDSLCIEPWISGQVLPPASWGNADIGFVCAEEDNAYRPTEDRLSTAPTFRLVRNRDTGAVVSVTNVAPGEWHDIPDAVFKNRFVKVVALVPNSDVEQTQAVAQVVTLSVKS